MKVEILNRYTSDGREFYEWSLWDGPEGVEEVHGYAADLITAFSKILEWHERIASDYAEETLVHSVTTNDPDREPTD